MTTGIIHEQDRELVGLTAPPDWENPLPEGRYNLVVVGAGPAGLVCAVGAAHLGARVALIEKHRLGGDCLQYGCVPSKALLRSSRAVADVRRAGEFNLGVTGPVAVDFPAVMQRMRRLRAGLARHDSAERLAQLGIDVYFGEPHFSGSDSIAVAGQTLTFARAVICTGGHPGRLTIPGLDPPSFLTNETVFDLTALPARLAVIGGGPIGCELAQAFRRFGSEVHLIHSHKRLLPRDAPEAGDQLRRQFEQEGIQLYLGARPISGEQTGNDRVIVVEQDGRHLRIAADVLLSAVGRKPNVEGLGLEEAGVRSGPAGVEVNDFLQTSNRRIYAAGDVCSPYKFTHAADAMGRLVLRNALFLGRGRASKLVIPWCTYTDPEISHVGLTEGEAVLRGWKVQTFRASLGEVDRGVLDGETDGFGLVHVRQGTDRILGATLVARHAGDMIGEIVLAMTLGRGLSALSQTIHPYPTQSEIWKKLGDAYQRSRLPPFAAGLLRRWLAWRR